MNGVNEARKWRQKCCNIKSLRDKHCFIVQSPDSRLYNPKYQTRSGTLQVQLWQELILKNISLSMIWKSCEIISTRSHQYFPCGFLTNSDFACPKSLHWNLYLCDIGHFCQLKSICFGGSSFVRSNRLKHWNLWNKYGVRLQC